MSDDLEFKPIDRTYVAKAIEKAEHYRLLNWPEEAESICHDILAVDPDNQKALHVLVLALSDQFLQQGANPRVKAAKQFVAKLIDDYTRSYMTGIIHEREGRAHLQRGFYASFAYESFRDAMHWYEKAQQIQPPGNQEAQLRYNSCLRTIQAERLMPREEEPEQLLE